mmetsp:Transcript_84837/g.224787  ORF Transcript_84837/g.224787 Transcript_84837/m.224787 type:complete len:314 (-) Transcript_84837:202-1143(-)
MLEVRPGPLCGRRRRPRGVRRGGFPSRGRPLRTCSEHGQAHPWPQDRCRCEGGGGGGGGGGTWPSTPWRRPVIGGPGRRARGAGRAARLPGLRRSTGRPAHPRLDVVDHPRGRGVRRLRRVRLAGLQGAAAHRALHLEAPAVWEANHPVGREAEQAVDRIRTHEHHEPEASVAVLGPVLGRSVLAEPLQPRRLHSAPLRKSLHQIQVVVVLRDAADEDLPLLGVRRRGAEPGRAAADEAGGGGSTAGQQGQPRGRQREAVGRPEVEVGLGGPGPQIVEHRLRQHAAHLLQRLRLGHPVLPAGVVLPPPAVQAP